MTDRAQKYLVLWGIVVLLIVATCTLKSQAVSAFQGVAQNQCSPAEVDWQQDTLNVESWGCIDHHGDTLIIIGHLVNGEAKQVVLVMKKQVKKIIFLQPRQEATMKNNAN
jgi:hypothetical protein